MTDPAPPPADDSLSRLPRHTTPTWEVELLISGVAVFAMLQLPGWLDDRYYALMPRLDHSWGMSLRLLYIYLESAALILAATFAIHLLLRAQWIAMVGMHSVFPDGIRWDRLGMGPVQREIEIRRYGSPAEAIERADNRATVVFSIGVMLASSLLLISLLVVVLFVAIVAVTTLLHLRADVGSLLGYGSVLLMMPMVLARIADRRLGDRLAPGGLPRRVLASVLRFYVRIGVMGRGSSNPVFSLLSSHGGERRALAVTVALFTVAAACVGFSLASQSTPGLLGNYALFPAFADGSRTLEGAHYDDQRDVARDPAVPYIRSAVSTGPWLRLVVPYEPGVDEAALRDACPGAAADGDAGAAAGLSCLQRLHAATLDGKPVSEAYELGSDPRTDRPALVAMIDVRALASGRHELRVARGTPKKGTDDAPRHWPIPFWR